MTEKQFQETRKVMQTANCYRGYITKAKADVVKWTAIEDAWAKDMQPGKAEGAKKCLLKALDYLDAMRKKFADIKLPTE